MDRNEPRVIFDEMVGGIHSFKKFVDALKKWLVTIYLLCILTEFVDDVQ